MGLRSAHALERHLSGMDLGVERVISVVVRLGELQQEGVRRGSSGCCWGRTGLGGRGPVRRLEVAAVRGVRSGGGARGMGGLGRSSLGASTRALRDGG